MSELIHLQVLLATFSAWVGHRQSAVISYLIEENRVLKEQLESGGRRLRFTDDQRLAGQGPPDLFDILDGRLARPGGRPAGRRRVGSGNPRASVESRRAQTPGGADTNGAL